MPNIPTVRWTGDELYILDQTLIPVTVKEIKLSKEPAGKPDTP